MRYGPAFSKIEAWNPTVMKGYSRVVLVDGDVLAVSESVIQLLHPSFLKHPFSIAASRDIFDDFNYGVVVLTPNAEVHSNLKTLLERGTEADIEKIVKREPSQLGFCDQSLVSGWLTQQVP